MRFKSEFQIDKINLELNHQSRLISLGSCFSENVGKHLKDLWFSIDVNPFGVLFNPLSIHNIMDRALEEKYFEEKEIQQREDLYFLYDIHGKLSGLDAQNVLENANKKLAACRKALLESDILILTFGTAYYYELKEDQKVVGNCHKMPSNFFDRKKISQIEISQLYSKFLVKLKEKNPNLQVILSVSPIRHVRDGFIENNRSKAELLLASEQLSKLDFIHYFPSYEIQMDELRDYRFYASDLNHPSNEAIEYIFDRFLTSICSRTYLDDLKSIQKINQQENHKSLFPESKSSLLSIKKLEAKKLELEKKLGLRQ